MERKARVTPNVMGRIWPHIALRAFLAPMPVIRR